MVIIDIVINTLLGRLTLDDLDPAGMHCPGWDDAFVSGFTILVSTLIIINSSVNSKWGMGPFM